MADETLKDKLNNVGSITVGDLIEILEQHRPRKSGSCGICNADGVCYYWSHVRPQVMKQFGLVEVNGIYDVAR